jgi:hypothetical protein
MVSGMSMIRHGLVALGVWLILSTSSNEAAAQFGQREPHQRSCASFTSHDEIGRRLTEYQQRYPQIARAFTIGTSVQGRQLWALQISAEPDRQSAEPEVRIIGAIHGNECLSAEMVLQIARWLTESYGQDPFVTAVVDGMELVLVPLLNPDGYSGPTAQRTNARGVDLNRNLGFAWVGGNSLEGPSPFSEPETQALRQLSQSRSFVLGLSYHTSASYVNGPWNYTPHHPLDEALVGAIGQAYAGSSGYQAVYGWDWYNITGDVNDWSLGTRGTFDWTLELLSASELQWPLHQASLRRFLSFAQIGAHGLVTDAETGQPLEARIDITPSGAPVYSDPQVGDYHRMLMPGTYSMTATAPGHQPMTVPSVQVGPAGAVRLDFALRRAPAGQAEHAFAVNAMTLPQRVDNDSYAGGVRAYRNRSMVWAALGPPDGSVYSISPSGSIILDLGEGGGVVDRPGFDLTVESGSDSADPVAVSVSASQDGPFVEVARGTGDLSVDVAPSGLRLLRYVRLWDVGGAPFNDAAAGYDLDAIVNLSPRPGPGSTPPPPQAGRDVGASHAPAEVQNPTPPPTPPPLSQQDEQLAGGPSSRLGGCTCRTAGAAVTGGAFGALVFGR